MAQNHPDQRSYIHLTKRSRIDTAVYVLAGILRGVSLDHRLNASEIKEVSDWCREHRDLVHVAPFSEVIPMLERVLADGVVDPDEQEDLLWLCQNLSPEGNFYDEITHSIQELHGIMHGVMADGVLNDEEIRSVSGWIDSNLQLKGSYPYDELDALLVAILKDGKIEEQERDLLASFFEDFIDYSFSKRLRDEGTRKREGLTRTFTLPGICASCPEISFDGKAFTFTGSSMRSRREDLAEHVLKLGGTFLPNLSSKTDFLVIGAAGNPCWVFSCYGRKVEKAVTLRKEGHRVVIVHETDFWDAVHDGG